VSGSARKERHEGVKRTIHETFKNHESVGGISKSKTERERIKMDGNSAV
jgi:hypothetical protein